MPSSIEYVSVTFQQDTPIGPVIYQEGHTCSLPGNLARGLGAAVVINGPGSVANAMSPAKAVHISEETVLEIGPSYCARMTPFFSIDKTTWSRINGIGSFRTQNNPVTWEVGRKFRIQDANNEWLEGFFTVLSTTPESSLTRITYFDARRNAQASDIVGGSIACLDLNSWSSAAGVPAYVSIAMGGAVRYVTLGTNGQGLVGWLKPERKAQIRSIGPVGAIVLNGGTVGSTVNDEGLSFSAALLKLREMIEFLQPQCRLLYIETPPPYDYTQVAVNSGVYTAAALLMQALQNIVKDYPFVRVIPLQEALITRYGNVDTTDLLNGQQPAADQCTDRVHNQQGASSAIGTIVGHCLMPEFRPRYALGGAYPDTRQFASGVESSGQRHPNLISGFFGAVPTNAASGTGITGTKPTAGNLTGTSISGSMAMVSSVVVNPDGGNDWLVDWVNPSTNAQAGTLFTMAWTGGRAAGELLAALNAAVNQGKQLDIWTDIGVFGFAQSGVAYADVALWVTSTLETEWRLASGMSIDGDYQAIQQGRGMTAGFNGVVRWPRFTLPVRTYTAAELRLTVKPQQAYRLTALRARVGPATRIEVVSQ